MAEFKNRDRCIISGGIWQDVMMSFYKYQNGMYNVHYSLSPS